MKRPIESDRIPLWAAVFAAALLPFLPALRNGFVNWDDTRNFLENPFYRGLGWTQLTWMFTSLFPPPYQPLSWLTLGADYCLWGLNPAGYHLTNLLLHAANAVLFFFVSARLLAAAQNADPRSRQLRWAAALSALLFAVHPLRVESVVWATERRDVLSGYFYLLTLLAYLRLRRDPAPSRPCMPVLSLGFYLLSLLSKGMGITLPIALLLLDVYPLRRLPADPRRWVLPDARPVLREKTPFFGLAVLFAWIGVVSQRRSGAVASVETVGFAARALQSVFGLAFYFWKTLFPIALSPLYLRPTPFTPAAPMFFMSAVLVGVSALAVFAARRRWPALTAAGLYYAATLAPVLGLFPLGAQLAADRYSYLSCLVWPLLAAGLMLRMEGRARNAAAVAAGVVLVGLGAMTWRQTLVWRDSKTLWRHALTVDDTNYVAHKNLAVALFDEGRLPAAISECETALRLAPRYADAHTTLAQILMAQGRSGEAGDHYAAALITAPNDDAAHYNLGVALHRQGRWAEAVLHYRRALELNPSADRARTNLGAALIAGGRWREAVDAYREALRRDPGSAKAHNGLGAALAAGGRYAEALVEVDAALALRPDDPQARRNRSWIAERLRLSPSAK